MTLVDALFAVVEPVDELVIVTCWEEEGLDHVADVDGALLLTPNKVVFVVVCCEERMVKGMAVVVAEGDIQLKASGLRSAEGNSKTLDKARGNLLLLL